jgi:hypothetical protein
MFFLVVERLRKLLPNFGKTNGKKTMKSGNGFYNLYFCNLNYNVFDMNATIEVIPY